MKWWRRTIVWDMNSFKIISYRTKIVPRVHKTSYDNHFYVHIRTNRK